MRCSKEYFQPGNTFHIYNHAVEGELLFKEKSDYLLFLKNFKNAIMRMDAQNSVFAYCLMPNHFHFLIRQESEIPIYKIFNSLLSSYVQVFNKKHRRKGRLFQSKLQHILVDSDQYLLYLCQYIHFNPVKAKLVKNAIDWEYSNYPEWTGRRNGTIFSPEIRDAYFASPEDYVQSLKEHKNYIYDLPFLRLVFRMADNKTDLGNVYV